jgi:hypothetical protein
MLESGENQRPRRSGRIPRLPRVPKTSSEGFQEFLCGGLGLGGGHNTLMAKDDDDSMYEVRV